MSIKKFKPLSPDPALNKIKGDTEFARLAHLNQLVDQVNTAISSSNGGRMSNSSIFNFKAGSVGEKVTFTKANYSTANVDVIIPGVLELARNNNQGLYNAAFDTHYVGNGPTNTEWSSPFVDPSYTSWAPLCDVTKRTFVSWQNALETPEGYNAPALQVGMPMVLKETTTNRFWLIQFTQWTHGNQGGGFSYDRWEILDLVYFGKPDYETSVVDQISPGVAIARGDNGPLYNAMVDTESVVGLTPSNTRWNSIFTDPRPGYYDFDDLTNLESRVYTDFTLALDYHIGDNVLSTNLIMHDLTTDLYYKVVFDGWTGNNNGGGFTYERTVIPQSDGVKFADGSVMNTAGTSSTPIGPIIDSNGNVIIEDSSNDTVTVGPGDSHLVPNFSGMVIVNDHWDGGVETWICGGGDCVMLNHTSAAPGNSTFTQSGNGYEWTNVDNLTGPFTFTVVKTRNGA